jgi:hypothetical protein
VCILCVCVFAFDLFIVFFVFILVPRHKSRESVKIRPPSRGHPLSALPFSWSSKPEWAECTARLHGLVGIFAAP